MANENKDWEMVVLIKRGYASRPQRKKGMIENRQQLLLTKIGGRDIDHSI